MSATSAVQRIEAFMQSDTRANMTGILRYCIEQGCATSAYVYARMLARHYMRVLNAPSIENAYRRNYSPERAMQVEHAMTLTSQGTSFERLHASRSMIMESSYAGRLAQREYNAMLRQTDRLL
jgi:hypothetical protein